MTVARGRAEAGQRGEAIRLLQEALVVSPKNTDARVLLGTIFSWEGLHDEARRELGAVLAEDPSHGDALAAMVNVELWSNHPARAEELASGALRSRPDDPMMLLSRARALITLKRSNEARETLDRLLAIEPRHEEALKVRRRLVASERRWQARAGASYDSVSDQRAAWREWQMSLGRATPIGSITLRASRAERFGLRAQQIELDMYPRFTARTYAYVAGAYSPDAPLYPDYRYAAELYQNLGAGLEGSIGFRRLGFGSGVDIYVASLSKYHGNWIVGGRAYVTPNVAGKSASYHGSVRRYFGDVTHIGLRYGRGPWRGEVRDLNDFEVLDSDIGGVEATILLGDRLEWDLGGSYGRETRAGRRDLRQYSFSTGLGVRF